jgi:hypothetical protein
LNGTNHLLVYADVNILGENIKKNTQALLKASREVGLEVNRENRVQVMSCHQKQGKIMI